MSESSVHQMRIFELRNKLKEVGLSSSGTKAELISRLSQYYEDQKKQEEVAVGEDLVKTEEIVENAQTEELNVKEDILPIESSLIPEPEISPVEPSIPEKLPIEETALLNKSPLEEQVTSVETTEGLHLPVTSMVPEEVKSLSEIPTDVETAPINPIVPTEVDASEVPIMSSSDVNMSQAVLEARCKRFGIPYHPTDEVSQEPLSKEDYQHRLEERRKRFGTVTQEDRIGLTKEKRQRKYTSYTIPKQRVSSLQGSTRSPKKELSEEEKAKLQARRKRFGLM